jgi:PIN domain nuclease of toxin-antitoxin system
MAKDNQADAGIPDTQLSNLTRQELVSEMYRRGFTYEDIMNKKLPGAALEAFAILNEGKAMGGSITKKRIGATDYRKGGYVLSTIDRRKK